ncbi:hypothetical protein MMC18_008621 [Xylographa bjoerkii]|nr:hypothetical protein [Xylographa bjoerkii]
MLKTQYFNSRVTILLLLVLAAGVLGRAVPYTAFEGRSPFEGRQMEAIERLRLRGASEEIFARFPHPAPAPVAASETPSQWSGFLYSVLAKLGVDSEQQGDVVQTIEEKMAGGEGEHDKRAVGGDAEEMVKMGAGRDMAGDAKEMQERSHEMAGDMGGMMDGNEHLDERGVGVTGEGREITAGDERATRERAADLVEDMQDKTGLEHADRTAMEERWTGDDSEHAQNKDHLTATNVSKDWKTSTEVSIRADTAIEKRRVDLDMENGGLEVHGQMGGLKGERHHRFWKRHEADIV